MYSENHRRKDFKNLEGQIFGKIMVIKAIDFLKLKNVKRYRAKYLCKCECGKEIMLLGNQLKRKEYPIRDCGCENNLKYAKNQPGEEAFRNLFQIYKSNAKRRGLTFDLSLNQFREITKKNCFYCKNVPSNIKVSYTGVGDYIYNGIDRVNNTKGYFIENCVPCCRKCNIMKFDLTLNDFKNHISLIYNNFIINQK